MGRPAMHVLLAVALLPLAAGLKVSPTQVPASASASRGAAGYYWPEPRGLRGSYSVSAHTAPRRPTQQNLAWSWFNGEGVKKYQTAAHSGLVMDGERSIYLSSTDGIRKFSHDGRLLWQSLMPTWRIPALEDGKVYATANNGTLLVLSMESGRTLWSSKFTTSIGTDISGVAVHDGVVITESLGSPGGGAARVAGLDARDGRKLWEFGTSSQLWNFMPIDAGNGSFVFQDQIGGVYRLRTADGTRLWHSGYKGPWAAEMTDGMPMVSDGVAYAVHSDGPCCKPYGTADLGAYDLATGSLLWRHRFPYPANTEPVIARLGRGAGLTERKAVVVPIGAQPVGDSDEKLYPSGVRAIDARTGESLWEWTFPTWDFPLVRGDFERSQHGTICLPNPYGSPSVDARGTLYVGHFNGMLYAIRDDDGDGAIQASEVSAFDTGAGFSHGGAVIAPGMLAIASCDGLFVFKE